MFPEKLVIQSLTTTEISLASSELVLIDDFEVKLNTEPLENGTKYQVEIKNISQNTKPLRRLKVIFPCKVLKATESGLQSFSAVRITTPDDFRPERLKNSASFIINQNHADFENAGKVFSSDAFSIIQLIDGSVLTLGWLVFDTHLSTVEITKDSVALVALLDSTTLPPNQSFKLSPFWIAGGNNTYENYLDLVATYSKARNHTPTHFGWCSWYQFFEQIRFENIKDVINLDNDHLLDVIQIDDGYQHQIGDWLKPSKSFEGFYPGFEKFIIEHGYQAGIWTAPFLVTKNSSVFQKHPDWIARDFSGDFLVGMFSPTNWGGYAYVLDTTNPDVLQFIYDTFKQLRQLGFSYFKCDFLYSALLPGVRFNQSATRAQSLRNGLNAIRQAIGDSFLLGCGCPIFPAVGIVDALRVSPDTAPFFDERMAPFGYKENSPALKNAIVSSILRAPMHRRLFINDPDCLLLRQKSTALTLDEINIAIACILGASAFVILSDDFTLYQESQFKTLKHIKNLIAELNLDTKLSIKNIFEQPIVIEGSSHKLITSFTQPVEKPSGSIYGANKEDFAAWLIKS
jgi:alpha-galactosidase